MDPRRRDGSSEEKGLPARVVATGAVGAAAADGAESAVDVFLTSGALAHIPVVRTVLAVGHTVGAVRDELLRRRLRRAIAGYGAAASSDWERLSRRLLEEPDDAEIVHHLLYVLDSMTSDMKAELVGRVLRAFADGRCDRSSLRRTIDMIHAAQSEDIRDLIRFGATELPREVHYRLAMIGLVGGGRENLTTGEAPQTLTEAGQLLLEDT
jgi:hypothetical protein